MHMLLDEGIKLDLIIERQDVYAVGFIISSWIYGFTCRIDIRIEINSNIKEPWQWYG